MKSVLGKLADNEWVDWSGSDEAPDNGEPMVFQVEFKSGPYVGFGQPIVWSDWINWSDVGRFRLPEEPLRVFEEAN